MAREPYGVYSGKYTSPKTGKTVKKWYVRFYSEDGAPLKTKTLKANTATKAGAEAKTLYETSGLARSGADPYVLDYLLDCWKEDSEYALRRGNQARGRPLAKDYISINRYLVIKHLVKPFKNIRLSKVNTRLLEDIAASMARDGLTPQTANKALRAFTTPFRDWCRKNDIPNPIKNAQIRGIETVKEKGILTIDEMDKIIALEGFNPRIKAAVLLGGLCGLRIGEAIAVQEDDIDREAGILHVRHNYIASEGVKCPKNGESRSVPLLDVVIQELDLCQSLPHKESVFILFNDNNSKKPIDRTTVQAGFHRMLEAIGIDETERRKRNLVFHGLRHHFVSRGLANGLSNYEIQQFAGHQSDEMMERYSKHIEIIDFEKAKEKLSAGKKKIAQ